MNQRILLRMTFTLALAALPASAFGQAAAESILLHSGSAAATVKAGSAMSSATNQASKRLAGRVAQQVSHPALGRIPQAGTGPVSTSPRPSAAIGAGTTTAAQGPVIASIQGGAPSCAPANQTLPASGSKSAAGAAQTNCQDSATKPAPQKYKSVITLSLPK
jgi:hypothetical protein